MDRPLLRFPSQNFPRENFRRKIRGLTNRIACNKPISPVVTAMGDFLPDNGFVLRFFALMGVKMGVKLFTYSVLLFGANRGVPL